MDGYKLYKKPRVIIVYNDFCLDKHFPFRKVVFTTINTTYNIPDISFPVFSLMKISHPAPHGGGQFEFESGKLA